MRKLTLLVLLVVMASSVWGSGAAEPKSGTLSLEYDFGSVSGREAIEYTFEVRHEGSTPLTIKRIHIGCGSCMTVDVTREPIAPGESFTVSCRLDVISRQGDVKRTVHLLTDSDETPVVRLQLKANVLPPDEPPQVSVRPDSLLVVQRSDKYILSTMAIIVRPAPGVVVTAIDVGTPDFLSLKSISGKGVAHGSLIVLEIREGIAVEIGKPVTVKVTLENGVVRRYSLPVRLKVMPQAKAK